MATITGLQSPNPYAQAVYKSPVRFRAAAPTVDTGHRAVSINHSYSPDWMQEDQAAAGIYNAKGETQKLSQSGLPANK